MMNGLTLIVMAAGVGSRYGGLKQVEPIGPSGEWIVDYSVYDAARAGFGNVVFVIRNEIEAGFRERFDGTLGQVCDVQYVVQSLDDLPSGLSPPLGRSKPWGTGHAVWSCRDAISGPFGVINADDFYGQGAFDALAAFLRREDCCATDYALVGYDLSKTLTVHGPVTRGICAVDADGFLTGIVEHHQVARRDGAMSSSEDGVSWTVLPPDATASMNMWGFGDRFVSELAIRLPVFLSQNRDVLDRAEFPLPSVVGALIHDGAARVRVLATDEAWFGVTFRDDVQQAQEQIARRIDSGQYPARLWST